MRHMQTMDPKVLEELQDISRRGLALCEEALNRTYEIDVLDHVYNSDYAPCRGRLKKAKSTFQRMLDGKKF